MSAEIQCGLQMNLSQWGAWYKKASYSLSTSLSSFCNLLEISLSMNSCLTRRIKRISVNRWVTVLSRLPISRFLGLAVIPAWMMVLVEAMLAPFPPPLPYR